MLHARIQRIAENAPADQIERYRWAAASFRIPYWDWSQGGRSGDVPDFFMTETIVVNTPEGRNIEIWNPLYKYDFKPLPSSGFEGKVSTSPSEAVPQLIGISVDADQPHDSMASIRKSWGAIAPV